ncbi:MAG: hypothetical protein ACR2QT_02930 [Woeseiaceae bacterium]
MEEYSVEFEQRVDYLHARVTGENNAATVERYLRDIVEECQRVACFKVLIDEQLEGPRLSTIDVFSVVSDGAMKSVGMLRAIAFVDEKMGEMADFAETVAVNRGMPVRSFRSIADAESWLSEQKEGPA